MTDAEIVDPQSQEETNEITQVNTNVLPEDYENQIKQAKTQNDALMTLMDELLEEGTDYGKERGIKKPFLHKPGAEQLCLVFKFRPVFEILDKTVDFEREPTYVSYDVKCKLYQRETGMFLGEGVGNCTNYEKKYKRKRNGQIFKHPVGKSNVMLKMAKKRAHVDAVLNVTGASRLFTQDKDQATDYEDVKEVEIPDDPGEFVVPFGYSKGDKLKDCSESTLKWAANIDPKDGTGEALKKAAQMVLDGEDNKDSNKDDKKTELTKKRQKEIIEIIGDNEDMANEVKTFKSVEGVESVGELSEDKYNQLKEFLENIDPEQDIDVEEVESALNE